MIIFCALGGVLTSFSQEKKIKNLPKYDHERLHFGFTIGFNTSNFIIRNNPDKLDSIYIVEAKPEYGFNLGIISDLRLHEYVTLRFLPDLSFQDRILNYKVATPKDTFFIKKPVSSTFIDLPVDLKIRSSRLNNMSAYILGGGKFSIDLASDKNVDNTLATNVVIKLKNKDWSYEVGAGLDFYFPYFKFSIELKASAGVHDLLIRDNNEFAKSIDALHSKVFLFSLNFEG